MFFGVLLINTWLILLLRSPAKALPGPWSCDWNVLSRRPTPSPSTTPYTIAVTPPLWAMAQ